MVQGALEIENEFDSSSENDSYQKQQNQQSTTIFNFSEQLIGCLVDGNMDPQNHRKSSLPIVAVINCLKRESEELKMESTVEHAHQFHVSSNISFLLQIAMICIRTKQYPDLAVSCLKEYMQLSKYFKLFKSHDEKEVEMHY